MLSGITYIVLNWGSVSEIGWSHRRNRIEGEKQLSRVGKTMVIFQGVDAYTI